MSRIEPATVEPRVEHWTTWAKPERWETACKRRTYVNAVLAVSKTSKLEYMPAYWSSLNTSPARPSPAGAIKIAIDITAVDVHLFFFTLPVQWSYMTRLSL